MKEQEIIEILNDWNFWNKELESGLNREIYLKRSEKSFIMRQIIKRLIKKGVDKKNILMINFEDRRFAEFYPKILDEIYETYSEFLKPDANQFFFLDEIHNVPKWEKWARTMQELGKRSEEHTSE